MSNDQASMTNQASKSKPQTAMTNQTAKGKRQGAGQRPRRAMAAFSHSAFAVCRLIGH
jgi:hypothetical protein